MRSCTGTRPPSVGGLGLVHGRRAVGCDALEGREGLLLAGDLAEGPTARRRDDARAASELERVLRNLLDNALAHAPDGSDITL